MATAPTRPQPHRERLGLGGEASLLRQPKTLEELRSAVRGAWTEVMTEEYCTTLADSMDARLRKLRGGHTGY